MSPRDAAVELLWAVGVDASPAKVAQWAEYFGLEREAVQVEYDVAIEELDRP